MDSLTEAMPGKGPVRRFARTGGATALAITIVLGLALRLGIGALQIVHHADEVWQYLEPAYGQLTGMWIQTWDIRAGIRSWLIPFMLMPPMALGHALSPQSTLGVALTREALALLSLSVVWAFHALGRRIGPTHALIAAFVGATWVEIVYFASRTSSDGLALTLSMPALALLYAYRDRSRWTTGIAAGALASLAFMLRIQLGPAIAVAVLGTMGRDWRRWWPLVVGALAGPLCDALANFAMGEPPFLWIYRNFTINVVEGKSAIFGTAPPWWYLWRILSGWHVACLLVLPSLVFGARRYPVLFGTALAVIATHALIPHKEYRFVLVGVCLLVLLAAIGSVDLAQRLAERRGWKVERLVAPLMVLWFAASVAAGAMGPFRDYWGEGKAPFNALELAAREPGMCAIAMYRQPDLPVPAYSFIARPVPVLMVDDLMAGLGAPPVRSSAYNVAVAPGGFAAELARGGFRLDRCMQGWRRPDEQSYCVFVRPGGCAPAPAYLDYNRALRRIGR